MINSFFVSTFGNIRFHLGGSQDLKPDTNIVGLQRPDHDQNSRSQKSICRWRRPVPELIPAIVALSNNFSPQYQYIKPSVRSGTQSQGFWSPSSASSGLFGLPFEILELVLYFLSPDLSNFALVNSDCRYLALPLQFRCTKIRPFVDDASTPHRHDYGALERLLHVTQRMLSPHSFAIAPYIRYLHLYGAGVRCNTGENEAIDEFSVQDDLVSLISTLTNLEVLSHRMPNSSALRLTTPYMLALMRSTVKHVALRGVLCSPSEVDKLQLDGGWLWPVETHILIAHWETSFDHPDTVVPSVLVNSCSKTLKQLALDFWDALDFFTESGNSFPALRAVHLDPTLGNSNSSTLVLRGHPVLSSLYSTLLCRLESISTLKRYACSIRLLDDPERLIDNLKRNPQLESLSITGDEDLCFPDDTIPMTLIDTICRMPQLRALGWEGDVSALGVKELQSIASMSMLQNLQLLGPLPWLELRKCMESGCMQALQWLSVGGDLGHDQTTSSFRVSRPLPARILKRIDTYRTLFEAELFAAALPSLQGCMMGAMAIKITNGKAQALVARPCSETEINRLWDHILSSTDTHLWHWD